MTSNSFLNDRLAIDRLKREYLEHKNLVIGMDFDNTVFDFHNQGLDLQPVIDLMKKCSNLGFTMCLWSKTIKEGEAVRKAWHCAQKLGITIDCINRSPLLPKHDSQWPDKPFFSILLDDRAGLSAAYNILNTALKELKL